MVVLEQRLLRRHTADIGEGKLRRHGDTVIKPLECHVVVLAWSVMPASGGARRIRLPCRGRMAAPILADTGSDAMPGFGRAVTLQPRGRLRQASHQSESSGMRRYRVPFASGSGSRPARMFTCMAGSISRGAPKVASRAIRMAANASSSTPSRTWTLPVRCASTVVSHPKVSRPGAL